MTNNDSQNSNGSRAQSSHARASARGVVDVVDPETGDMDEIAEIEEGIYADDGTTAFFYGTLMTPEVFFRVCYGRYSDDGPIPQPMIDNHGFKPAILHGYIRHKVRGADYPGIIPHAEKCVRGIFVTNLTEQNVRYLDLFEGSEYKRCRVMAKLLEKVGDDSGAGNVEGEGVPTISYVFKDPRGLEEAEWDFDHFKREKLWRWA
ncbi:uncharacterized protein MKZ38_008742 [Zalerion maritima]|uniref:Putative gamma-glutamylcyclotransferase n=1 Tax=Zalerion maritima TaxID=339359 RepID=A0AAD5RHA5_9PEZI|nr:uncharacterized protein MKZ38_008742 [Zalerion maritima]